MSFWKIDLMTEDGAANAATTGSAGSFVAAALTVLGAALFAGAAPAGAERIGVIAMAAVSVAIFLIAGWRLRNGKGVLWGGAATALLVIEILSKLITLTGLFGLVVNVILLIVVANGVRGAWALRRGFDEDAAEVFE